MEICQRCNGEDVGEGESWCEKCHIQLGLLHLKENFKKLRQKYSKFEMKEEGRNESKRD